MRLKIWAAIVIAAFGWGTTGVATRAALHNGVPPIAMAAIRAALSTIVLFAWFLLRGRTINRDPHNLVTGLVAGVFQLSLPFIFFVLAYQYASAGFIGLLVALIPLGTATVAHYLLPDEPLRVAKVVALAVAFAGVGVLLISGDSGLATGGRPLLAALLTIGAVLSISFASVFTRGRAGTFDTMELTLMQFVIGTGVVGGTMLVVEGMPGRISGMGWLLILYLTAAGSLIPTVIYYWLLQRVTSTMASLVGYVTPLIALVAGIVLLGEKLQMGIAAGGALILIGLVFTDHAERTAPAPRPN